MAHAEVCPVCQGKGKGEATCHGCGGKGWVEVGLEISTYTIPLPFYTIYPSYYPSYPWEPCTWYPATTC